MTGPNSVYAGRAVGAHFASIPKLQLGHRAMALREGLLPLSRAGGPGAGRFATIDVSEGNWASQLQSSPLGINYRDWRVGVVTSRSGCGQRGSAFRTVAKLR